MTPIRNIAIIAHVDHGKTTLVDRILHQSKLFRENQHVQELVMDSNELERERGITIFSKNCSVQYKGIKINIIDTPGHADFGGEVERVLNMADGVLLLVDALEGPMPQTRFVLQKALALGLKAIVVINKVDKPNCNPEKVHEDVFELFFNLNATEEQLNFPVAYGSSKQGWMSDDFTKQTIDISFLLELIVNHIPSPPAFTGIPQMQITSLDYTSFVGRIAVGRLFRGTLRENMPVSLVKRDSSIVKSRIKELYSFEGLSRVRTPEIKAGEICAVMGLEGFEIGDTISDFENPAGLKPIAVDEPTMSMLFMINNSPFFGQEGKFLTSRQVRDRLFRETEKNLALKVEETDSPDSFIVYGRGILHLSIVVETMRREGFELQLGQPKVVIKEINGVAHEPIEILTVDVPQSFSGKVIDIATQRRGMLEVMETRGDRIHLEFSIPSRGLMGIRNILLNVSEGEAVMAHRFEEYEPIRGNIQGRINGTLIVMEAGMATAYSIDKLQDRGKFFISPGEMVYVGQVVGEQIRPGDLVVNVVRGKKLTNMRASGSDDAIQLTPPIEMNLERALEYIDSDEYVEVTPKSVRMRKKHLKETDRKRADR